MDYVAVGQMERRDHISHLFSKIFYYYCIIKLVPIVRVDVAVTSISTMQFN